MQLGALVVTSRRTFDIFDCRAYKAIAGLTSPIGLQTSADDYKKKWATATLLQAGSKSPSFGASHVKPLFIFAYASSCPHAWHRRMVGAAITTSALQLMLNLAEQKESKHLALTLAMTEAKTFELEPRPLDVTRISQSHRQ